MAHPPIDPSVFERREMRHALAERDIGRVFALLVAAGVAQREIARLTSQSQSQVSEILHGRRVLSYDVLARIADGLGVQRGWLGLSHGPYDAYAENPTGTKGSSVEEVTEDMRRRAFLTAAAAAVCGRPVLGEVLGLPAPSDRPTPLPSRLVMADVEALRNVTERLREVARTYGGQGAPVASIANRSARLMTVGASEQVKQALGGALADLHTMAGWCCFDSHAHDASRAYFTRALELATEYDDAYRASDAAYHAAMAMQSEDPNGSLKLLQLAQFRLGLGSNHPRADTLALWLHVDSAHSLAMMGHTEQARSSLAAARDGWDPADRFDRADMDHVTAQVHRDLGMLDSAEGLAASSVRTWGEGDRRDGVQAGITLAGIHLQAGEADGLGMAEGVIRDVAGLQSMRARQHLAPLADALAARRDSDSRELAVAARRVAAARA